MATIDTNALLLQVMAHDLLAPLTATKWQLELLARPDLDENKRHEYLSGIHDSTELGIRLTKYAHVAGKVLVASYEGEMADHTLPDLVRDAAGAMTLQYERHGITLDISLEESARAYHVDKELVGLFVWSLSKFFMTCSPAQTTVGLRGMIPVGSGNGDAYTLIMSAPNIPECDACVAVFTAADARGTYDQAFVFAHLIDLVAPAIGARVTASNQNGTLMVEATFE